MKPRLLGHWGTTLGLNFICVHLNRVIRERGTDILYICGPGHGGPAMVANTYLEGSYSETYPVITRDEEGLRKLFRQFSFPGGVPSHVAPRRPVPFTRAVNYLFCTKCGGKRVSIRLHPHTGPMIDRFTTHAPVRQQMI